MTLIKEEDIKPGTIWFNGGSYYFYIYDVQREKVFSCKLKGKYCIDIGKTCIAPKNYVIGKEKIK